MENLDIIILTSVLVTLFIVFIVGILWAVKDVDENSYKYEKPGGPRVALFNLMARLAEDKTITKKEKKVIYKAMYKNIADMESEGMYFPDEVIEQLKKQKEELICHYSGLPSTQSWEK